MESGRRPWKLNVYARFKNMDFKFKATYLSQSSTIQPYEFSFSLLLKFCPTFLIKIKSEPQPPAVSWRTTSWKPKHLKSKFLAVLEKFRNRARSRDRAVSRKAVTAAAAGGGRNRGFTRWVEHQGSIYVGGPVVVANLAPLCKSIFEKDQRKGRIIMWQGSVLLLTTTTMMMMMIMGMARSRSTGNLLLVALSLLNLIIDGYWRRSLNR